MIDLSIGWQLSAASLNSTIFNGLFYEKCNEFSGFGVLFLVLVLLYLRYDKTGYYYGVECSFVIKYAIWINTKINFDYPQSFYLLDEDGFELVGIGFRYKQSSFRIKNFWVMLIMILLYY